MMNIPVGGKVKVTVKGFLKTRAARHTLSRLFLKDRSIVKLRNQRAKATVRSRRAGRFWINRDPGSNLYVPAVGDSATFRASVDVIRDLQSVAKYVSVN